jgi:hypothetical protein
MILQDILGFRSGISGMYFKAFDIQDIRQGVRPWTDYHQQ